MQDSPDAKDSVLTNFIQSSAFARGCAKMGAREERSGLTYNEELVLKGLPGDRGLPSVPDLSWPVQPACFSWRQPVVQHLFFRWLSNTSLVEYSNLKRGAEVFSPAFSFCLSKAKRRIRKGQGQNGGSRIYIIGPL